MHRERILRLQMGCGESLNAIALLTALLKKEKLANSSKLYRQNRNMAGVVNQEIN